MEEFTNGVFFNNGTKSDKQQSREGRFDAHCPYCGWIYDQPEEIAPKHASCAHLVATAQWSSEAPYANAAAFIDDAGAWKFWKETGDKKGRESIEQTFRSILTKIESSTAGFEENDEVVRTRYYFARRPSEIRLNLSSAQPCAPRITADCPYITKYSHARQCSLH
jgi:hypothetical protein